MADVAPCLGCRGPASLDFVNLHAHVGQAVMLESHLRTDVVRGEGEIRPQIKSVNSMILASSL